MPALGGSSNWYVGSIAALVRGCRCNRAWSCFSNKQIVGLHVGGKTALEWYGVRQYVSQRAALHLYGWVTARLPDWFGQHFSSEYQ